jgi:hypothetical protein
VVDGRVWVDAGTPLAQFNVVDMRDLKSNFQEEERVCKGGLRKGWGVEVDAVPPGLEGTPPPLSLYPSTRKKSGPSPSAFVFTLALPLAPDAPFELAGSPVILRVPLVAILPVLRVCVPVPLATALRVLALLPNVRSYTAFHSVLSSDTSFHFLQTWALQ